MVEGDFAVPEKDGSGISVHQKLLRRKGLAPEAGVGLSTGPGEGVVGAG